MESGPAHQDQQVGEVRRGHVRQLTFVPGAGRLLQRLQHRRRLGQTPIAPDDGFGEVAQHPFQAFEQRGIGWDVAIAELVQAPQVIGDPCLFADEVLVRFRQSGQVRRQQPVGVMALQFPARVSGQCVDAVVQCGAGSGRRGQEGPVVQRRASASAASRALSR